MKAIPDFRPEAEAILSRIRGTPLSTLPKSGFVQAWWAVAYLNPGFHPDGFNEEDSGWPSELQPFAEEAWRRFESGELADEELYPADAAWSALYDLMKNHSREETDRRQDLRKMAIHQSS